MNPDAPAISSPNDQRFFAFDWRICTLILVILWAIVYVPALSRPPLLDDVDTVHAEAAREMLLRHDWVTLHTNGIRYMEKAPLMFWLVAASYRIFGIHEWTTRLPLSLGVLLLALATYRLGRYVYGELGGLLSGIAVVTSLGFFVFTRYLIPEVLIALLLTLGYGFFLRATEAETPSRFHCWGFAITCALNVLMKGLIGLVFPFAAIGIFLLLTRNLRLLPRLHLVSSTFIFLLIAVPWHVLAALRNPTQGGVRGFLWLYFVNEHLMRFLGKRVPPGFDTVPLGLFWVLLLLFLLPWCLFLPQALGGVWRRYRDLRSSKERGTRSDRANLLFFLWPFVIVSFFSFSTRQEYYALPGLPGLALLAGGWLARESDGKISASDRRVVRVSSAVLFVVGILAFAAGMYLFRVSLNPPPGADLADLLKKNPADYDLAFGHVLDLTPLALGVFRWPLLAASIALLLGTGMNWLFRRSGRPFVANVALTAMMLVLLTCVRVSYATFSPILSSYDLAVAIQKHFQPGDVIVVDAPYHEASSLNFYTGIQLHILHEPSGNLWYGAKFPDAPHIFQTKESLTNLWNGPATVFVWTDQDQPKELSGLTYFPLARSGGKSIVTNHLVPH